MNDSYLQEIDAQILEVIPEGANFRILLTQTVFYPMGGGQPTDQGTLTSEGFNAHVYMVMMKDGEIWHYVKSATAPVVGMNVHGHIDWNRRYKNMKVHSAGHVVDFAMHLLGYSPSPLTPFKGDHGKKPFIVYQGTLENDIRADLEKKANDLIQKNLSFSTNFQPLDELKKEAIYLQPGLPTDKPLRTLRLESVGAVADGGTQVKTTGEVGAISISSIEQKEGMTIIHYRIAS